MISTVKRILIATVATFGLLAGVALLPALAQPVHAQVESSTEGGICEGLKATGSNDCKDEEGTGLNGLVRNVLNILSWAIGVVAVIMIIIGGFRYIVSSGESSQIQSAKNTILYAIVGLVVVLFAQLIVRFVIGSATRVQ